MTLIWCKGKTQPYPARDDSVVKGTSCTYWLISSTHRKAHSIFGSKGSQPLLASTGIIVHMVYTDIHTSKTPIHINYK